MRVLRLYAALLALIIAPMTMAQAPTALDPQAPPTAASPTTVAPVAPAVPAGGAPLERGDVEAWLDGFMPFALARSDIAGGVVVVVKDGQVLLQKGYGYSDVARRKRVDPDTTLFRPGSVSKLFTWTAVMQLVGQGKLDLDRDVNAYLDFKIPPYEGKPVTLRNIMTHTAGFEETVRELIKTDPKALPPLDRLMREEMPQRVFAPGTTPAYSNYATALAGHIVARVSGKSFDDYIDQHVFAPIGMTRSTFRQPLPRHLQPLMSQGYSLASQEPQAFEIVVPAPAGSMASTGADMAKFMIAHLAQGRGLLSPQTANQMHNTTLTLLPPLNRMALGFYEQDGNGRRVIAHGGDTQFFHSDLWLYPREGVGVFVSLNSSGAEGSAHALRQALFDQFADRYFPAPRREGRIDPATARQHAQMMAGTYTSSRGSYTNFVRILELVGQAKLGVDEDGGLVAPAVTGLANQPRKWIEIAPFVWRDVASGERLAGKVVGGKVVRWSFDTVAPFTVFDRTPWYRDGAWLLPALLASLGIVLITALAWPVGALARRRYKAAHPYEGRAFSAQRLTHGFAWLTVIAFALWTTFLGIGFSDLAMLSGPLDWLLVTAQVVSLIAFFGLFGLAAWNAWLVWSHRRGWLAKLWSVLLLLAALIVLWVGLGFNLIGFGLTY